MVKFELRMNALEEREKEKETKILLKTLKADVDVYDQDYLLHANQSRSLLSEIGSLKRKRGEQEKSTTQRIDQLADSAEIAQQVQEALIFEDVYRSVKEAIDSEATQAIIE
jgi:hypothetical protein